MLLSGSGCRAGHYPERLPPRGRPHGGCLGQAGAVRERIAGGEIGKPLFARAEFSFLPTNHGRTWIYDRSVAGGGPIADIGVHCIDALRYILQDEVQGVTAVGRSDERSGDVAAAAILTLEFR